jgi:hypothetical protein
MIQTSYFAKAASLPNAVAISQGIPKWYTGARYKPLAPSWEMIHLKDPELYKKRYYQEVLSKLDPEKVASDLEGCILLCHELKEEATLSFEILTYFNQLASSRLFNSLSKSSRIGLSSLMDAFIQYLCIWRLSLEVIENLYLSATSLVLPAS